MHVILGILGSILTILYMLDRLGIDLGGLNPFYWRRRRSWRKQYQSDPIYSVDEPRDVAAILVVGAAKLDGDISAEQKKVAVQKFQTTFSLTTDEASNLFGSAAHLLGSPQLIDTQLEGVIEKNKGLFSNEQTESMLDLIAEVVAVDGAASSNQVEFLNTIRSQFIVATKGDGTWS